MAGRSATGPTPKERWAGCQHAGHLPQVLRSRDGGRALHSRGPRSSWCSSGFRVQSAEVGAFAHRCQRASEPVSAERAQKARHSTCSVARCSPCLGLAKTP